MIREEQERAWPRFGAAARIVVAAAFAAGLAGHAANAAAQAPSIVGNGGFEAPAISSNQVDFAAGSSQLSPWVIGGHSVSLIGDFWVAAEGRQSLDLNGSDAGAISQTLTTLPNRQYTLRFKFSAHPSLGKQPPKMTVRWGPSGSPSYTESFTFTGDSSKSDMKWVTVERTVQATSASTALSFTSDAPKNGNYGTALDDVSATLIPPPYATPTLIRVYSTGGTSGTSAYLIGRVDGASSMGLTVQPYAGAACVDGALVGGTAVGTPVVVTTDADGYFGVALGSGVTPGHFVTVQVITPVQTDASTCLVSSAENDTWPKALQLSGATPTTPLTARDYIDGPGRARWYKFDVLPGQKIQVSLAGLPADYDLAVFKDIGATFLKLLGIGGTGDLTRLSAEYAPSTFSPSTFSPSTFSPSTFSPDAYSPSTFSPSTFSSDVFSPSTFSPSTFSPSTFSPSTFSPSTFSPSTFSPSTFSPSTFSPSTFSPSTFSSTELAQAFSSAQTRSLVGVSATPGAGDELVVVNSFNNVGTFYVRVAGRSGAYSTTGQFLVDITKEATGCPATLDTSLATRTGTAPTGVTTLILTDSTRTDLGATVAGGGTLAQKLAAFAGRAEIGGAVVDVNGDSAVVAKRAQAVTYTACPYAKNLLATEIKGIVDWYRKSNAGLRYVVIVGGDDAIPFFRYPDQSLLGEESGYVPPVAPLSASEASLRLNYVLSQDAYGAATQISLRINEYPVPGLAVGRLVESPTDIAGLIDAYAAANGVIAPTSSLVTGYDFLEDAANAVKFELEAGTGTAADTLITPNGVSPEAPASWNATQLGNKLLGSRHDVIFLAGHFSANSALAADFTTSLITTDLAASSVNLTNSLVFSAGCHSGYNLVDGDVIAGVTLPLDWAQAFAAKKATLIAGTGYQYGDTDFIEYSERLYKNFARQLRAGTGAVAIGEALVKAKQDYLASTPDIRGIHEKALLEATLFGLPMLSVNMSSGRGALPGPGTPITPTAVTALPGSYPALGLKTANITVAAPLTPNTIVLNNVEASPATVTASWLSGPDGVVSNPVEPALPLVVKNATSTDGTVLRGVGFRGGNFTDTTVTPLTGAATMEIRGVHVPFVSPVFFPMRAWTVNYFGALSGTGGTSLLVTPVQHRASDIANALSTRRVFSNLDLRLYYSGYTGQPALSDAPSIVSVIALPFGAGVEFTAQITGNPNIGIQEAWITYTSDGAGTWTPLDLAQCATPLPAACGTTADSRIWKARLGFVPTNLKYVIQAANGAGVVTFDDNRGLYYGMGGLNLATTSLALVGTVPTSATFGESVTVSASLSSSTASVASKNVIVSVGGAARAALTDGSGQVTVTVPVVTLPGPYKIIASFPGDDTLLPSAAAAPFQVNKASTQTALTASGVSATLTATLGAKTQPLLQESVKFTVTGGSLATPREYYAITDYIGRATFVPTGLSAGTYSVTASFAGNATYTAASSTPQSLSLAAQTITFGGGGLPPSITHPGSTTFTVSSASGQPVTVTLSPSPSPYCTLTFDGISQYTLTTVAPGTCTVVTSAGGTTTYAEVTVTTNIAIMGSQAITFGPLGDKTFGDPDFSVTASGGASGNPVTFSTSSAACTVTGAGLVHIVTAGGCTIDANQAGSAFYNAAPTETRSFTVNAAAQTISFPAIPAQAFVPPPGTGTFAVSATAPGGTVTFSSLTTGVCTVSGTTVTMLAGGTCTVQADQSGSANYLPAPPVTQSVTINKASQTITFANPGDKIFGDAPFGLSATASPSNLPVTFTAAGSCTVADAMLTLTSTGTCSVTASQAGDTSYAAAADVVQTFRIDLQSVWTPTAGDMTQARSQHTATRLANGKVLIAGGIDASGAPTASSELYDPATRTFAPTGNMPSKSAGHSATLLPNGKVVVFGGGNSSAQAFDPATNTWSSAGSTSSNRSYHTATLLGDGSGRVLIAGGADNAGKTLNTTIIYNPDGTFVAGPNLTAGRERHTATLLPNGKVLIAGGRAKAGNNFNVRATTEICDATACTAAASMATARRSHAAILVSGKVLVVGGSNDSGDVATGEIYDPAAATPAWSTVSVGSVQPARRELTLSALPNGRALGAGGHGKATPTSAATPLNAADVFQPPFGTIAPMLFPRARHTATPLVDSYGNITGVLVTGGLSGTAVKSGDDDVGTSVKTAEVYGSP